MNLAIQALHEIDTPTLSYNERAQLRCLIAKELEEAGNYEAARNALGELWQRIGDRPILDGLDRSTAALVLLRAGTLSGWIGSAKQVDGAQETAKDLISESIEIYESLGETAQAAEARTDLAICYWREGAFDEARIVLRKAVSQLEDEDGDLKALALLRSAIVERTANRLNDALRILTESAPLFEKSCNQALKGNFHNTLALVLRNLGDAEKHEPYIDQALIEYAAASHYFEQCGHLRHRARVENNLGFLFFKASKLAEAHEHLDNSRRLFVSLKDSGNVAQVDETRARVLLAQGRNSEAERVIRTVVHTLRKGDEQALLAESLTTHGVALARLSRYEQAQIVLEHASEVAKQAGDKEGAGRAVLTIIEELSGNLTPDAVRFIYERADHLLAGSLHLETLARLRECARHVIAASAHTHVKASSTHDFIYAADKTADLIYYARKVAAMDGAALITGETGTGKEVLARLIHEWSGRRGPFVAINCATLCETLIESQLFGHRKGSFTNALEDYAGAAREAAGGTLFLDEISEISVANQAKLLRLIEHGELHPLGSPSPEGIDIRVIAATNQDLKGQVARGLFRTDLFYRLATFHIEIPPLRERPEDILALAKHFIEEARKRHHKQVTFTPASLEAMRCLPLNGNARELRTLIERTFLTAADGTVISAQAVDTLALRQTQKAGLADVWAGCSLEEEVRHYEGRLIEHALSAAQGSITRAARLLGLTHQGLAFILNGRHKNLLGARSPAKRRRSSIMRVASH